MRIADAPRGAAPWIPKPDCRWSRRRTPRGQPSWPEAACRGEIHADLLDWAVDERWPHCPYCGGRLVVDDREGPERGDKMEEGR